MKTPSAVAVLSALAHADRLALFRLLVRRLPGRVAPAEIIATLELGPSLVSAHLRVLTQVGLLSRVRQGKSLRYRAEIGALDTLARFLVEDCCQGRTGLTVDQLVDCCTPTNSQRDSGGTKRRKDGAEDDDANRGQGRLNILFLDHGNVARALVAEAVTNARHPASCRAWSAVFAPSGQRRRSTLQALRAAGYDTSGLRAGSPGRLAAADAPDMHVVVTLSPEVADIEPRWRGHPVNSHWDVATAIDSHRLDAGPDGDPDGDPDAELVLDLERRVDLFVNGLDGATTRRSVQRAADSGGLLDN